MIYFSIIDELASNSPFRESVLLCVRSTADEGHFNSPLAHEQERERLYLQSRRLKLVTGKNNRAFVR